MLSLRERALSYFASPKQTFPLGILSLGDVINVHADPDKPASRELGLTCTARRARGRGVRGASGLMRRGAVANGGRLRLMAPSVEDAHAWLNALNATLAAYKALLAPPVRAKASGAELCCCARDGTQRAHGAGTALGRSARPPRPSSSRATGPMSEQCSRLSGPRERPCLRTPRLARATHISLREWTPADVCHGVRSALQRAFFSSHCARKYEWSDRTDGRILQLLLASLASALSGTPARALPRPLHSVTRPPTRSRRSLRDGAVDAVAGAERLSGQPARAAVAPRALQEPAAAARQRLGAVDDAPRLRPARAAARRGAR